MSKTLKMFPERFCCTCMNQNLNDLKHMFDVDNDGVSYYNKLTSSITEMNFKEMNDQRLICGECCVTLNTVYNFRQTCLRSKTSLITYLSQLQTSSHVSGTTNDCLQNVKQEIMSLTEEIEIKCENKDSNCWEENDPLMEFKTEESNYVPASVKEERESEEEASSAYEDASANYVNEDSYNDVKVGVEHQTMKKDEPYAQFSVLDVKQDLLTAMKKEPMPDTETPQDGSTSQADAGSSGIPKEIEKCMIGTENIFQKVLEGSNKCEICGKIFNRKSNLNYHMRTHSGVRPYECEICKKGFTQKCTLTTHMKTHAGESKYECEICGKGFNFKSGFIEHKNVHSGERPYECDICHKKYIYKTNLIYHSKTHSGTSFECEVCKMSFVLLRSYKNHMKTHSGERPHKCEICKKTFIHKNNLGEHMKIHTGLRPYECEICKKTFIYKNNLSEHMKTHIGVKPHQCEVCQKSFIHRGNLIDHMKIHSGDRPYECEICNKTFIQKTKLTRHMKTHNIQKTV